MYQQGQNKDTQGYPLRRSNLHASEAQLGGQVAGQQSPWMSASGPPNRHVSVSRSKSFDPSYAQAMLLSFDPYASSVAPAFSPTAGANEDQFSRPSSYHSSDGIFGLWCK